MLDVGPNVATVARMQPAARNQALSILFNIISDELIHSRSEPNDLRSDVIDEHGAIHAGRVQMLEKCFRRTAELGNLLEVRPLLLDQLQRRRVEHFERLNVDVAVGDQTAASYPRLCGLVEPVLALFCWLMPGLLCSRVGNLEASVRPCDQFKIVSCVRTW